MKHLRPILLNTVLALWSALALTQAQAQRLPQRAALGPVEGEVIVAFRPEATTLRMHALAARSDGDAARAALQARASALGGRVGRTLVSRAAVGSGVQVVHADGISAEALAHELAADPEVLYAEPNGRKRASTAPNDPLYSSGPAISGSRGGPVVGQWYLRAPSAAVASSTADIVSPINAEAAWALTQGSGSVVVAVLDTGVRKDHPDLAGRLLPGYDFVSDATVANDGDGRDADPSDPGDWVTAAEARTSTFVNCSASDSSWHGTATASLVGARTNDGVGMAGAAPGVLILPVRVLGKCYGSDGDITAGMRWAAGIHVDGVPDNPYPAKIINMSLGGGTCNTTYQSLIAELRNAGVLVVASAGNSAGEPLEAPASCAGVVGVVAVRNVGTKVGFSSLGSATTPAGIAAPGGNCVNTTGACLYPVIAATNSGSTAPAVSTWFDSFNFEVGTSFSSPLAAAAAALVASVRPASTPDELRAYLSNSARAFPTRGGTAGIGQCQTPAANVTQDECYCTTSTCGAGMLDAAGAVTAAMPATLLNISYYPVGVTTGNPVDLRITGLQLRSGRSVLSYSWTLVDGGGASVGFASSSNASTATLATTAAGTATVRLTVTDNSGETLTTTQLIPVAVAATSSGGGSTGASSGSSGGGAASAAWVCGVALAAAVLLALRGLRAARRRA